jgi:hypothetical protein
MKEFIMHIKNELQRLQKSADIMNPNVKPMFALLALRKKEKASDILQYRENDF